MYLLNSIKGGLLLVVVVLMSACSDKNTFSHGNVIIVNGKSSTEKDSIISLFLAKNNQNWVSIKIPAIAVNKQMVDSDDDRIGGLHLTVASLAQKGENVIVDYESQGQRFIAHLQKALNDIPTFIVGVRANNDQSDSIHSGWRYNLEINLSNTLPEQAAERINQCMQFKQGISEMEHASQQSCFLGTTLKR